MYFKINPSGCGERKGLVEVRYDLYLDPEDHNYQEHHVTVPVFPPEGYPRQKEKNAAVEEYFQWLSTLEQVYDDTLGQTISVFPEGYEQLPVVIAFREESDAFDSWYNSLSRVWRDNPFCCHFFQHELTDTPEDILKKGGEILTMAYQNWQAGNLHLNKNPKVNFTTDLQTRLAAVLAVTLIKGIDFTQLPSANLYRVK